MAVYAPAPSPNLRPPIGQDPVELGRPGPRIEERRSFAPWQLAVACVATLILGMIIGYSGKKPSASSANTSRPLITLPPATRTDVGGTTTTVAGVAPGTPGGNTTTTAAASGSSTQIATVLMQPTKGRGTSDLPTFTTAGTFSFGWAYDCAENAGATGTFAVTVVPATGSAGSPAVTQSGQSNQGVFNAPATTGTEHLHVDAGTGCIWILKVTGIAS
jgi:hypothetical protein